MGYYDQGLGQYNLDTAQARSINTDTYMRWNQYLYEAHLEATRRYVGQARWRCRQDQGRIQRDT